MIASWPWTGRWPSWRRTCAGPVTGVRRGTPATSRPVEMPRSRRARDCRWRPWREPRRRHGRPPGRGAGPGPRRPTAEAAQGGDADWPDTELQLDGVVPIAMEGNGPLVVREKFHSATPMTIDRALLEMELVGHDFFLFRDETCHLPSVVYRRRGYHYGVIRLVEEVLHRPVSTTARQVPVD